MARKFKHLLCILLFSLSTAYAQVTIDGNGIGITNGGIAFPDGTVQTTAGSSSEVYDGNDQFLGVFISSEWPEITIYVPSSQEFVCLYIETGSVCPTTFYYESSDCSGTPYIKPMMAVIVAHGGNYYKADEVPPSLFTPGSASSSSGSCYPVTYDKYLVPIVSVNQPLTQIPAVLPLKIRYSQ